MLLLVVMMLMHERVETLEMVAGTDLDGLCSLTSAMVKNNGANL